MANEPSLYDMEFPNSEVGIEGDVEIELGLAGGLDVLYHGLTWWPAWWRTAVKAPNHDYAFDPRNVWFEDEDGYVID